MPTLVGDSPMFQYFANVQRGMNDEDRPYQPSKNCIGTLSDITELDAIVPAINTRVEIERTDGIEEVRVINDVTGDFHSATGASAVAIFKELDRRTAELLDREESAFPPGVPTEIDGPEWKSIIMYDHEGHRLLPALRHTATISDYDEFNAKAEDPMGIVFVTDEFVGLASRRTGDLWLVTEEISKRVRKGMKRTLVVQ